MRVEYRLLTSGVYAVELVDDEGRRWRTDVRIVNDPGGDEPLVYKGLSIAGRLPRRVFEGVIIEEFERSTPAQRRDWLPR